ncbi:MAG: hypothetical protein IPM25_19225 [Chloracidobacterium sp.]|nr:hypothetical protein [Chloracidobacterium sp.]
MEDDQETMSNEAEGEAKDKGTKGDEKAEGEGAPHPCGKDEVWDPVQQKCVPRTK